MRTPPHLLVHESKFGKSRYVVLHPSTAEHLRIYLRERHGLFVAGRWSRSLPTATADASSYTSQWMTFRRLLGHAGIQAHSRPARTLSAFLPSHVRSEAAHALASRTRSVQQLLPHLAVYLGHLGPENTYWYVSSTPELLDAASAHFESQLSRGREVDR